MESLLQQVLNLLIKPPGNLIYHLVLAFSIVSALQAAVINRRTSKYAHIPRMITGLSMLLLGQAVLYISSGLAWQGILDERLFLPILDRAIVFYSLVWIIWLWNFPAPARLGDLVTGFLFLAGVLFFFFSYSNWIAQDPTLAFNQSWIDKAWGIGSLAIVIIGMAVLLFSRPSGWPFGLGMLALSTAGLACHLLLPPAGGFLSGFIRLGQLAAFPLLPTLLNRLSAPGVSVSPSPKPQPAAAAPSPRGIQERRRYSSDPRTVHAWLTLLNTQQPENVLSGIARALSHTMLADMCFVVGEPAYGHIVLQSGYDLIREETVPGNMLEQGQLPALASAIQRGKTLRITESTSQAPDLSPLVSILGLTELGSVLYIPLLVAEKPSGGVLFLSPYSKRQWTQEDQEYLTSEYGLVARVLQQARQSNVQAETAQTDREVLAELENLRQENQRLADQLAAQGENEQKPIPVPMDTDLSALIAIQQEAQEQIATLQNEVERLQTALQEKDSVSMMAHGDENVEAALRSMLQETAHLQNRLAEANARNLSLERELRRNKNQPSEEVDVAVSIIQEIRQPMSSIVGYTDLLLSESVGILGTMQRKFLERIKASIERMHGTINDLIQVTAMGHGPVALTQQPIELESVVDNAIADTSAQLREKNIALRVDLAESLPEIYADRDALQQIVLHLLQNAGAATPSEGSITLRAHVSHDNGEDYLLIQVSDSGGGVHPDDLARVFSRRYRADLPLIQGLGDTGVGLSIAKTLVEAHRGRVWVDSSQGEGTTFSVLMPIRPERENESQI